MNNKNKPVCPVKLSNINFSGLTKREYFAGLAMQGFAAASADFPSMEMMAEYAVKWADSLLNELEDDD